jgi:hypothetical protein
MKQNPEEAAAAATERSTIPATPPAAWVRPAATVLEMKQNPEEAAAAATERSTIPAPAAAACSRTAAGGQRRERRPVWQWGKRRQRNGQQFRHRQWRFVWQWR